MNDWKAKLKKDFTADSWNYGQGEGVCLVLSWRGRPVLRKAATIKNFISDREELEKIKVKLKKDLLDWFDHMVINYDDLTPSQKHRLKKVKPVHETEIGCSDMGNYAILKRIKVRYYDGNWEGKKMYSFITKNVILELK